MSLKIATFNVNGVNARLGNLLAWLRHESPDIACLQELKAVDSGFPAAAIEAAGYRAIWHGERSWNGVAILSRNLRSRRATTGTASAARRRPEPLHRSAVGGIVVASLYLPNGNPQPGPNSRTSSRGSSA